MKKILCGIAFAAVLLTSLAGCSQDSSSSQNEEGNSKAVESSSLESGSDIEASSQSESSGESEQKDEKLQWETRDVNKPEIKNSAYNEKDDSAYNKFVTADPELIFDFEKTKEALKKYPKFTGFEFVDIERELQEYCPETSHPNAFKADKTLEFVGYNDTFDEVKKGYESITSRTGEYEDNQVFRLKTTHTCNASDKPNYYELTINSPEYTQEDIFEIAKAVFGKEIAEYLVYQTSNFTSSEKSDRMREEIKSPDGNDGFVFERVVKKKYDGSIDVKLTVEFFLAEESPAYKFRELYYNNGYKPMEWEISLSDMIEGDVGETDYNKAKSFFNKAFSYGNKLDPYTKSSVDNVIYRQTNLSDGTVMVDYLINAHRLSEPSEESPKGNEETQREEEARNMELSGCLTKNTDGSITVRDIRINIPTACVITDKETDMSVVNDCLELSKKQLADLLKLDNKTVDSIKRRDESNSNQVTVSCNDLIDVNLFGQSINAKVGYFSIAEDASYSSSDKKTEYHSYIWVSLV